MTSGNYVIKYAYTSDGVYESTSASSSLTVSPATLTPIVTVAGKVYDGATTASLTGESLSGVINGDTVSLNVGTAAFASKNAGVSQTVDVSGLSLSGSGAGNYHLASTTATTTATISPAPLSITAVSDTKTYDGTNDDSSTPSYQVAGLAPNTLFPGDNFIQLGEVFESKDVMGTGNSILDVNYVINDGTGGGNYDVTTLTASGTISAASLTIMATSDSKTYDGTTDATATPTATGLMGLDTLTGLAESFDTKNVGNDDTLSVTAYTVNDGNGGADYTVATKTSVGTITPAPLTITAVPVSKTYDGTTKVTAAPIVVGLMGSDTVTGLNEAFTSQSAGTGKTISIAGYTINDGDGGADYTVTTVNKTGTISPAPITVLGVTAENKSYDTTTVATLNFSAASLNGVITGDAVLLNTSLAKGTFASSKVGNSIAISVSGLTIGGSQASDYALTQPSSITADIEPATPTITWTTPASITYGTALTNVQLDATATLNGSPVSGTFNYGTLLDAKLNAGNDQTLSVNFTPNDTTDFNVATGSTTINVAQAKPALSLSAPNGTFNGTPFAASVTISGTTNTPAASLDNVVPTLTYYQGSGTAGTSLGATAPTVPGTYTVVANFPGDNNYASVQSAPAVFVIGKGSASISLATSSGSAVHGQVVTLVASVSASTATPGGTVTFSANGEPVGTAPIDASGKATLRTSSLVLGSNAITATYSGDANFAVAHSGPASVSVAPTATQVVLVTNPVFKKKKLVSLGLTVTIEPTGAGAGIPTGLVTIETQKKTKKKLKVTTLGSGTISGGAVTLPLKSKQVLNKPIIIDYGGDSNDLTSSTTVKLTNKSLLAVK